MSTEPSATGPSEVNPTSGDEVQVTEEVEGNEKKQYENLKRKRRLTSKIYDFEAEHHIERIKSAFVDMYLEYGGSLSPPINLLESGGENDGGNNLSIEDKLSDFDRWYKSSRSSNISAYQKSELDMYLDEPVFSRKENFNILEWWKTNAPKLPTLAKMARDVLAIPATTIASESAFSVVGRVLDEERASLLPDIVEALITTDDWIETLVANQRAASSMCMQG